MKINLALSALFLLSLLNVDSMAQTPYGAPSPMQTVSNQRAVKQLLEGSEIVSVSTSLRNSQFYHWVNFEGCTLIMARETQVENKSTLEREASIKQFFSVRMLDIATVENKSTSTGTEMKFQVVMRVSQGKNVLVREIREDQGPKRKSEYLTDEIVMSFYDRVVSTEVATLFNLIVRGCKG